MSVNGIHNRPHSQPEKESFNSNLTEIPKHFFENVCLFLEHFCPFVKICLLCLISKVSDFTICVIWQHSKDKCNPDLRHIIWMLLLDHSSALQMLLVRSRRECQIIIRATPAGTTQKVLLIWTTLPVSLIGLWELTVIVGHTIFYPAKVENAKTCFKMSEVLVC